MGKSEGKEIPATKMNQFLISPRTGNGTKVYYTRENDEQIVKLMEGGKTIKEIAKKIGHSPASVTYRISRVLSLMHSFNEYDYDKRELNLTEDQRTERKAERDKVAKATASK